MQRTGSHAAVMRNIHKLPFGVPCGVKACKITELGGIVCDFYSEIKQSERSKLAYKGGHYEKGLLAKLNIPSINLENFGCPKAEVLINELVWLETCGNHTVAGAYAHCAKLEVEAYAQWLGKKTTNEHVLNNNIFGNSKNNIFSNV